MIKPLCHWRHIYKYNIGLDILSLSNAFLYLYEDTGWLKSRRPGKNQACFGIYPTAAQKYPECIQHAANPQNLNEEPTDVWIQTNSFEFEIVSSAWMPTDSM